MSLGYSVTVSAKSLDGLTERLIDILELLDPARLPLSAEEPEVDLADVILPIGDE